MLRGRGTERVPAGGGVRHTARGARHRGRRVALTVHAGEGRGEWRALCPLMARHWRGVTAEIAGLGEVGPGRVAGGAACRGRRAECGRLRRSGMPRPRRQGFGSWSWRGSARRGRWNHGLHPLAGGARSDGAGCGAATGRSRSSRSSSAAEGEHWRGSRRSGAARPGRRIIVDATRAGPPRVYAELAPHLVRARGGRWW